MIKKFLLLLTLAMILSGLTMTIALAENSEVTSTDKDGMILYSETSGDAKLMLAMGETDSDDIKITKNGNITQFQFKDHRLGCGTLMTGTIIEEKQGSVITVKGDFNVTHNPYKIQKLLVNISNNLKTKEMIGTLTIDGKVVDVNLLR
jgi:hypothetical protein